MTTGATVASLRSEVDRELLDTVSLDIVGSFAAVNRVRREHQPLVLGGIMIEDLVMLLSTVGLPNFLSRVGAGSTTHALRSEFSMDCPFLTKRSRLTAEGPVGARSRRTSRLCPRFGASSSRLATRWLKKPRRSEVLP
jgi:hypothetical protein